MSAATKQPGRDDPTDNPAPIERSAIPIWLIVLFAIVGYWALVELSDRGGGFKPEVYEPFDSVSEETEAWPVVGVDLAKGKHIFETYCAACHQVSGLGVPGQFPPLAGSDWVNAESPNRIIRIVLNGATGHIKVGNNEFSNTMVPWKDQLTDDDIAAVLSYVRGNADWGNKASPIKASDVAAIREKTKDRSGPWTEDELLQIKETE